MENAIRIDADTSVRQIIKSFPATREIFDRHGLFGCGGREGPAERLSVFARVHQMDLDKIMEEIQQVVSTGKPAEAAPVPLQPAPGPSAEPDARILPRLFIRTSMLAFVTGGCLAGAMYLSLISRYGTFDMASVWPDWTAHVQGHAHVQLSGWVTLFIMGIAYFALPRFLAVKLPKSAAVKVSYGLMLAGIVLRVFYQPFSAERWAANWVMLGAAAEVAAAVLFLRVVLQAVQVSAKKNEPYVQYLIWGGIWLLASQSILLVHATAALVDRRAVVLSPPADEAYLHLMLMGFISLYILGVTLRTVPLILDFRQRAGEQLQRQVLEAWNLGLLIFVAGQLSRLAHASWSPLAIMAGSWVELIAGIAFLKAMNPFQKPQVSLDGMPSMWLWMVRAAYVWFAAALLMEAVLTTWPVATGAMLAAPYWGAFRHGLTVGFVSMIIFGMAYRMIPVMEGRPLAMTWTAPLVFWLANLGTLGRVSLQSLSVTVPGVIPWMSLTGVVELSAGVLFTFAIWETISSRPEVSEPEDRADTAFLPVPSNMGSRPQPAEGPGGAVHPETVVGEVLDVYPDALAIFVRYGMTALQNPAMRAVAAKRVTIAQACRMHGVDLDALLRELNGSAGIATT